MGLATPVDTPEAPPDLNATSDMQRTYRTTHNEGPTVKPHILDIALAFSGRNRGRKIAEVDGTEPPDPKKRKYPVNSNERHHPTAAHTSFGLPPRPTAAHTSFGLPPRPTDAHTSSGVPPRPTDGHTSSGLPPRPVVKPTSRLRNHEDVDPLLHKSIVTPPCPILAEDRKSVV